MKIIKPPRLRKGDTIALMSTSSSMAYSVPHRRERAMAALTKLGFEVILTPNALAHDSYTAGSGKERADDFNWAVANPRVRAVISFIGGHNSIDMIPYVDFEALKKNPKIFCGYSDTTVIQQACLSQAGIVTFSGPAALTQFAEYPEPDPYTIEYFLKAVTSAEPIGEVRPSEQWTEEILDWFTKADLTRPRHRMLNEGWEWLRQGKGSGPLIGGCISSFMLLPGTPAFPDFTGSIMFWEIPEGSSIDRGEELARVDAYLKSLALGGVLKSLQGMIIGRPFGYTSEDKESLKAVILDVVKDTKFPILLGVDIGHTDPMITVPMGVKSSLDASQNSWRIDETAVSN